MPSDRRRPETLSSPKREQIIDQAAELFDRKGHQKTSMFDIADATGLSKSTLYHYFLSKDEILGEIHDQLHNRLLAQVEARATEETDKTARERLLVLLTDFFELLAERPTYFRVFYSSYQHLPNDLGDGVADKRRQYRGVVESVLTAGVQSGEFRGVDPKLATLAILGMANWAYEWFDPTGPLSPTEMATELCALVLRGLER